MISTEQLEKAIISACKLEGDRGFLATISQAFAEAHRLEVDSKELLQEEVTYSTCPNCGENFLREENYYLCLEGIDFVQEKCEICGYKNPPLLH